MALDALDRGVAAYLMVSDIAPPDVVLEAMRSAEAGQGRFRELCSERMGWTDDALHAIENAAERLIRSSGAGGTAGAAAVDRLKEAIADVPTVRRSPGVGAVAVDLPPEIRATDSRYTILSEVGRGGMGRVLKARDLVLGRQVAMKVLLPEHSENHENLARFWQEIRATGGLEHPSIAPIHDVGRLPTGELFYVMKLLSGQTLAQIVSRLRNGDSATHAEFSRIRLLTVFQQVAYAVAFAHSKGVIHRDIKPGNIMVGRFGEAVLLDWGLARVRPDDARGKSGTGPVRVRPDSAVGTVVGTPQYMAPEATYGVPGATTTKSDVYSLGAVLYELLTFEPPFEHLGFAPTIAKVQAAEFVPPRLRAPGRKITPELEELCLAAMLAPPEERPSAREFADDIGRILEGTRERERRLVEASEHLKRGDAKVLRRRGIIRELEALRSAVDGLREAVAPWSDVDSKAGIWALEDRVESLELELTAVFEEAEAAFRNALNDVPDFVEAREALAALYFEIYVRAEADRDTSACRYYERLVRRFDPGGFERRLQGEGSLTVTVRGVEAEVSLAQTLEVDRVAKAQRPVLLGPAPLVDHRTAMGSYDIQVKTPQGQTWTQPVHIGRDAHSSLRFEAQDFEAAGDGFCVVGQGPATLGGDPWAHGSTPRQVKYLRSFAMARYPVTSSEYLAFINDLAEISPAQAQARCPRVRSDTGHYWRPDNETGLYSLPHHDPDIPWEDDLPILGVSLEDALAYVRWRAERTGLRLRLPHEEEWEKAARGVDGRFFPWGDRFDSTFCKMKTSRDASVPYPEPIGMFEQDRSPFGLHDVAGGIREICWTHVDGEIVPVMRGGCWHDTELFCRVAFRHPTRFDFVNTGLGFRLVLDLGSG